MSCGSGSQKRTRSTTTAASCGGSACAHAAETQACNAQACPVDCVVPNFSGDYSSCTTSCGGGTQYRTRSLTAPKHGGAVCPASRESRDCGGGPCPIHCATSTFSTWTACTQSCGQGAQSRSRTVTTRNQHGGYVCPYLEETRNCNQQACATDCATSTFSTWTACTQSCGTGSQKRSRTQTVPTFGGKACPHYTETRTCNGHSCPINCAYPYGPSFGQWSTCTTSCAAGSQRRTRAVVQPRFGGAACPHTAETQACDHGPCPIHCATSTFSAWTTCTKSCGQGAQSRSRSVTTRNQHSGYVCPYLAETRNCNQQACAVDCIVGEWRAWSTCSKSCAIGSQSRGRTNTAPTLGGSACPATSTNTQTRTCNTFVCPVDGGWSAFGSCDQFCGTGSQSRTCTSPVPAHGGASCPGSATGACNTAACPKAPKCFVTASGETTVEYTNSMTPSFKCAHTATKCKCTASGHPTHHKGGCQQIDGTNGKTHSFAGDCTSTGKN
jgi:hypothetical protein